MKTAIGLSLVAAAALSACSGQNAASRDQIKAVGSSTVYPFAKIAAEEFTRDFPQFPSPIIEATGTGGGIKLFCSGVGVQYPDIANASRRMKASEYDTCKANGVDPVEVVFGKDGVAIASAADGIRLDLTVREFYQAIAAEPFGQPNTAQRWNDINPAFPDEPILVYGPPPTSGTRDALAELIMTAGCRTDNATAGLKETQEDRFERICTEVRTDGRFVEQGENDNLIVQKLVTNPKAVGVFGYSFLEENADRLQGQTLGGVEPDYENIASNAYPGARPLYLYMKKQHMEAVPGLKDYAATWVDIWGKDGLLARKGMIASSPGVQLRNKQLIAAMTPLDPAELK
ncbi:substrate-binding domain-containing protein [Croceicoccus sp. F390]|uniref:Substrate-binding domain-containing protein n=1 Tax=Croceicoccus esteveae TaxID=3075597 RepID=A0ABU2ZFU0_9SPHN|nr:substrate-binding domain-containing protein [Croceicoccus sp. F390]MDT0575164.1 substrate-binding domain-containing protein [Croceicoccus sp. F390]